MPPIGRRTVRTTKPAAMPPNFLAREDASKRSIAVVKPVVLLMTEGARAFARRKLGDAQGALEAGDALLAHTLRVAESAGEVVVCVPPTSYLALQLARESRPFLKQTSGPLGARVSAAMAATAELHPGRPILLVGDDCPGLTEEHLAEAVEALEHGAETVVGRAQDGGFWLLGLARYDAAFAHQLAANIDWSTPRAFTSLRRFLQSSFAGPMALLPELSDLDAPSDLAAAIRSAELPGLKAALAGVRPGCALARPDDETTLAPRGEHGVRTLFRGPPRA